MLPSPTHFLGGQSVHTFVSRARLPRLFRPAFVVTLCTSYLVLHAPFRQGLHLHCHPPVEATNARQSSFTTANPCAKTLTWVTAAMQSCVAERTFALPLGASTALRPLRPAPPQPLSNSSTSQPTPLLLSVHTPVNITRSQPTTLLPTVQTCNSTSISLAQPTASTPVNICRLCSLLDAHPDKSFANYVSPGMSLGFDVGFRYSIPVRAGLSSSPNHPSALGNKQFVSLYFKSCCESGLMAGPFSSPLFLRMFVSCLGIVPKENSKLRVIHDLSSPDGSSVNDGIYRDDFSPDYATVDMAVSHIMSLGRGSYLTKVDAFRLCLVQPSQWFLLGIYWEKQYYYDRILPFGLRSALFIFDKFADSLQWILQNTCKLQRILHYLDDFLDVAVEPKSASLHHWGQRVVECCSSAIAKQWSCGLSQALATQNLSWPSFAACTIPVSHIIPWSVLSTFWALLIPLPMLCLVVCYRN